jgi:hypothetical protein
VPEPPVLSHEQAGRGIGVCLDERDIDALSSHPPKGREPEAVGPDTPDEGDRAAKPCEADRDVRLGSNNVASKDGDVGERPALLGDESYENLAERCNFGRRHSATTRGDLRIGAPPALRHCSKNQKDRAHWCGWIASGTRRQCSHSRMTS